MRDLFVLTADADSQAMIGALLRRVAALHIRPISFEVRRFPGRDSGMVKEGPEIARVLVKKTEYSRLMLFWDHHGSGWERLASEAAEDRVQQRLDGATWTGRSCAIVAVPELEEWLWTCPDGIAGHVGLTTIDFRVLLNPIATKLGRSLEQCCRQKPKELFEAVLYRRTRRGPLPEDFRHLGSTLDVELMLSSTSFARFAAALQSWFPC